MHTCLETHAESVVYAFFVTERLPGEIHRQQYLLLLLLLRAVPGECLEGYCDWLRVSLGSRVCLPRLVVG